MHVAALALARCLVEEEEAELESGRRDGEDEEPDEDRFIEVPAAPAFSACVFGSRASLAIEIDAHYGEIDFPACSLQADRTVWLEDPDDDLVRRVRSIES